MATLSLAAALQLVPSSVFAGARLVRDINTGQIIASSQPTNFVTLGSRTYFTATTGGFPSLDTTLFVTDGTGTAPVPLHQFASGLLDGSDLAFAQLGEMTLFVRYTSFTTEVWRTDDTPSGTVQVTILEGTRDLGGGLAFVTPLAAYHRIVAIDGTVLFTVGGDSGLQLWATDGTAGNTRLVYLFTAAPSDFDFGPAGLIQSGGLAYFVADDGEHGRELWASDGTEAGTHLVRDIFPGPKSSQTTAAPQLTDVAGMLFFSASDGVHGFELWTSDGTETGTRLVRDINPGFFSSDLSELTALGNRLFFGASDSTAGQELWTSDGTEMGTYRVAVIFPGSSGSYPVELTVAGNTLYFTADDGEHGRELWRSDGATVTLVGEARSGPDSSNPNDLVALGDRLLFSADDGVSGPELWEADNSIDGVRRVRDIYPGANGSTPTELTANDGVAFFSADDGVHGTEPWRSDGTEAGTFLLANLRRDDQPAGGAPSSLVDLNGTLLFIADDGIHGYELWASGGSEASTYLVADINPNGNGLYAQSLVRLGNNILFAASNGSSDGLWRSDGTEMGTVLVARLFPSQLTTAGSTAFFAADGPNFDRELWRTDGTTEGTTPVAQFNPGLAGTTPEQLTVVGNRLFFNANDGEHGTELWVSDGTAAGTHLVRDIQPGSGSAFSDVLIDYRMVAVGDVVYFAADDGVHGDELWKSDGTEAGTVLVRDIEPGSDSGLGPSLIGVAAGNNLFFFARGQLWISDGTEDGTHAVGNPPVSAGGEDLVSLGRQVYFPSDDGIHGAELWKSDGSAAGTAMVADIAPGPDSSTPYVFTVVGNQLFFDACTAALGCELWSTQGTGAQLVADIAPGSDSSYPDHVTLAGGRAFFGADSPTVGFELFALDPCSGDCDGNRAVSVDEAIRAVGIALGLTPVDRCPAADANGDGLVMVDDLVAAVSTFLNGCQ